MNTFRVSVCIATYNGEKYISQQIDSILEQLGENDEVIVSDDGSTDHTISIIKGFSDQRIKLFNNKEKGVTKNFENALKKSTGEIIFLSDQDDVWLPNKVKLCLKTMQEYDLVVTNCKIVDENLKILHDSYFYFNKSKKGFFKNFYRSSYLGCCLCFRRKLLDDILPIPSNLHLYHDWWIGFIADFKYNVYFEKEPCLLYRRTNNNMSTTGGKSQQSLYKRFRDRFQLFFLGLKRILSTHK